MTHSVKKLSDTTLQLTVGCDAAELATIKQNTLMRLAKKVKVAGFRPGKVPAPVAAKNLDPNYLNSEVLEDAVNSSAADAIEAEKIMPLDRPKVEVVKYVPDQELEYTAEIEVIPEVKLGDYKKLKVAKQKVNVTDKEVADVIDRLRASMATKNQTTRAAKQGDEVIIDFEGTDADGKAIAGASGKDYPLSLGSNTFIPGFEEGLIGKKPGDTFDLPLTFPKDYHHKPLAGAKVIFKVTVRDVKEVVLPELNDDFASKAGPFKTAAELTADVTRELTDQKEREAVEAMKDSLVEQLVKGSHVPTPEILINDQIASLERDFVQNLMYRGITLNQHLEQQGKTKEEWRNQELREHAIRRVQVGLALAELGKVEEIEVKRDELEARLKEMLERYGNSPEMVKQLDTAEARRDIANRLATEKTIDHLIALNTKKSS